MTTVIGQDEDEDKDEDEDDDDDNDDHDDGARQPMQQSNQGMQQSTMRCQQ